MGNCIQALSESVTLIASDDTWIEGNAIQQLHTTARLAGMRRVAGMPDLHPGRGYPVGAAFLHRTPVPCPDRRRYRLRHVAMEHRHRRPQGRDGCWKSGSAISTDRWMTAGSRWWTSWRPPMSAIGRRWHHRRRQPLRRTAAHRHRSRPAGGRRAGAGSGPLVLLVHSGSRGLGRAILEEMSSGTATTALPKTAPIARPTWPGTTPPLRYAQANRQLVARRMLDRLGTEGGQLLDVHHNLVTRADVQGEQGWLHRRRHAVRMADWS